MCGKVLCNKYIKEKIQAGKYRILGDLCPTYIMNIQSLRVEKLIVWGIWKLEAAYSHDSITIQVRIGEGKKKSITIAIQDVFKARWRVAAPS